MTYTYYGQTTSLCEECLTPVQAKVVLEAGCVYYLKYCPVHKYQKTLISTDIPYYKKCKEYLSPSINPIKYNGAIDKGCPFDCGLCEDHEQHTAMGIVEILDECNMQCPTCIAASRPGAGNIRSLEDIELMIDTLVEHEENPDLLMISGGEPSIHPQIYKIIELAKSKPIKHIMMISNGVRIAKDKKFVEELRKFKENFEVYLQFDSLTPAVLENIRGENLKDVRLQAIKNLEEAGVHSTLICVVKNGLNEHEVNEVIDFALQFKYIRGVTFQPCKDIGRTDTFDRHANYITLSEVRSNIIKSSRFFDKKNLLPHPLNPENICIGYLLKDGDTIRPVTSQLFGEKKVGGQKNIERFDNSAALKRMMYFLPELNTENIKYENLFRVAIVSFLDQYNFCTSTVRRSSIHFLTTRKEIIPIDTYYLLYQNHHKLITVD